MDPTGLHAAVEKAFNDADVDALVRLYEPGARLISPDGSAATGLDEIRATWAGVVALGDRITMTTRYVVEVGDFSGAER